MERERKTVQGTAGEMCLGFDATRCYKETNDVEVQNHFSNEFEHSLLLFF